MSSTPDWTPPWLGMADAKPLTPRHPTVRPRSWNSPRWGSDAKFSEGEHDRDQSGKFTSGGAEKPPFAKKAASGPAPYRESKQYTHHNVHVDGKEYEVTLGKKGDLMEKSEAVMPVETKRRGSIRWSDNPKSVHARAVALARKQFAADMALDSARSRALLTARFLITATNRAMHHPKMAFDRALVFSALASQTITIAMDQTSVRTFSPDGHLHVALSNISRASVNPYFGKEIPDSEKLGLDPEKKYMLLRHPEELKKAAQTFNGIPILIDHRPISADDHPQNLVVGTTGTDARYEHPFLQNSLHIWSKPAIDAIQNNERRELSCAYHYVPILQKGTYEGKSFDGIMSGIHGNHVALVESGRVGPAAIVADAMPVQWRTDYWR